MMMWIKAAKWLGLVGLALGMVYGVYALGEHAGSNRVEAEWGKAQSKLNQKISRLEQQAREREQRHAEEVAGITDELYAELNHAKEERDSTIANLHNDNRKLRERFRQRTCVPGAEATSSQSGSDETGEAGLSRTDEEFLIRIASQADEIAHRLTACQAILTTERKGLRDDGSQ